MKRYEKCIEKLISNIKKYLHKGALKDFALFHDLNQCDLSSEFRRVIGKTFKKCVNDYRKTIFEKLLTEWPNEKGYTIAYKLGFKTEHQFYKWVKKNYGATYKNMKNAGGGGEMLNKLLTQIIDTIFSLTLLLATIKL